MEKPPFVCQCGEKFPQQTKAKGHVQGRYEGKRYGDLITAHEVPSPQASMARKRGGVGILRGQAGILRHLLAGILRWHTVRPSWRLLLNWWQRGMKRKWRRHWKMQVLAYPQRRLLLKKTVIPDSRKASAASERPASSPAWKSAPNTSQVANDC